MNDDRDRDEGLRAWLRLGDPAVGGEPTPAETARLRQSIIDANAMPHIAARVTFAAAAILGVVLLLAQRNAPTDGVRIAVRDDAKPSGAVARQIRFVTDGGTRVVWTLDPALDL